MIQSTEGKSSADGVTASLTDETKLIIGWCSFNFKACDLLTITVKKSLKRALMFQLFDNCLCAIKVSVLLKLNVKFVSFFECWYSETYE